MKRSRYAPAPLTVAGAAALLCLALGACATQATRCEGKLEPINPPAPQSIPAQADGQHGQ